MHGDGLWPSEAATARIVTATRVDTPPDFDISALRADLHRCRNDVFDMQIDAKGYRKNHLRAGGAIAEHAWALRALLISSGNGLFDWQLISALDPGDHDCALALLDAIARKADKISSQGIGLDVGPAAGPARKGTKDSVVGLLVPIYERHLKRPAGRSHDSSGPFPRFVEAVSAYMGRSIRVSRHTVHKSLAARGRNVGKK
jgi:hypothetical protein